MAASNPPDERGPLMSGDMHKLSMSGLLKHWNKRFFVLYGPKSKGSLRLEYYDDQISQRSGYGRRVIPLRDCSSCSQVTSMKSHPFVFQVTTPLGRHMFAVEDQNLLDKWVTGIRTVVKRYMQARFQGGKKSSRQSSSSSIESSSSSRGKLPEGVLFRDKIVMVRTNGAQKANLSGSYVLVVTSRGMVMYCPSTKSKVAAWGYKSIRTYGKSHKSFHFETGRSSEFGPSRFEFEYKNPKEIFTHVNTSIKNLAGSLRDERQSAGELRQPPSQKQRPTRAQSMYTTPTMEEEETPTNTTSKNTSIHLENPLQQLKALHQSFDNRPVSYADSRGKYHKTSFDTSDDIFWEEDIDLTDFSDMTDFHNSPPSYQDVLKKDQVKDNTEQKLPSPKQDVFGNDPFSSFANNSHSFTVDSLHTGEPNTPFLSPTTPPLEQGGSMHTPFDSGPFVTSSPNANLPADISNPFDEFGPLQTTTSPSTDPWGISTNDTVGNEPDVTSPASNPFNSSEPIPPSSTTDMWQISGSTIEDSPIHHTGTKPSSNSPSDSWDNTEPTAGSPSSSPWDNTEPTAGSRSSSLWGNTEPTAGSPSSSLWGNTEPTPGSPSSSLWGNTEPTPGSPSSSPWDNTEPIPGSPSSSPWDNTEPTPGSPSSSPWGNTEPTPGSPSSSPWDNTEPTPGSPSSSPWDNTEPTPGSPSSSPWDNTEPTPGSPSSSPWDNTEPTPGSPSSSPWGNTEPTPGSPSSSPWGNTEPTPGSPSSSPWGNTEPTPSPWDSNGMDGSSEKTVPKSSPLDRDPWSFSTTQTKSRLKESQDVEENHNMDNLLQDLEQMTENLFNEIADIQLFESA